MNGAASRKYYIDLIKTIAIIGVVTIHVCAAGFWTRTASMEWLQNLALRTAACSSVPLFLMASGALMLDREDISTKKIFTRSIPRFIACLFVYGMIYKLYDLRKCNDISLSTVVRSFKEIILFNQESHLYYLNIIVLVYVMLPVTRIFIKNASKKDIEYFLIFWFAVGIFYPTFREFWPFNRIGGIGLQYLMNMTYASCGYGILGYYLEKYPIKKQFGILSLVCGLFFSFFGTLHVSVINGNGLYTGFLEGMTLGVCLVAIGIYSLCVNVDFSSESKRTKFIVFVSRASYFIYLFHMLVLKIFKEHGMFVKISMPLISVPVAVLVICVLSTIGYLIISRIPVAKKWLC